MATTSGRAGDREIEVASPRATLRYSAVVKKSNAAKLKVRRETLRALADIELARVLGGDGATPPETGKELCHTGLLKPPG
jgi:hypothetical protein